MQSCFTSSGSFRRYSSTNAWKSGSQGIVAFCFSQSAIDGGAAGLSAVQRKTTATLAATCSSRRSHGDPGVAARDCGSRAATSLACWHARDRRTGAWQEESGHKLSIAGQTGTYLFRSHQLEVLKGTVTTLASSSSSGRNCRQAVQPRHRSPSRRGCLEYECVRAFELSKIHSQATKTCRDPDIFWRADCVLFHDMSHGDPGVAARDHRSRAAL